MITIRLNGGLGNQMFQYAMGRALAFKYNKKLLLDIDEFDTYELRDFELNKYNIKAEIFTRKDNSNLKVVNPKSFLVKLFKKFNFTNLIPNYYLEKSLKYDENIVVKDKLYLEGYFQNEKHFAFIRDELLKDFTIKQELSDSTKEIKTIIESSQNSVALHIRRGDYVANSHTNNVHGTCSLDYYDEAIEYLKSKVDNIKIFVFSDDIKWVKENLKYENIYFVEDDKKRIAHEDIYLMSLCHHNIIANSSFSWWGAWLNINSQKIVIGPKNWFADEKMQEQSQDIVCENWERI